MSEIKRHDKPLGASGTDVVGRLHNQDDHIEVLKGVEAAAVYDRMRRSETQVRKVLAALNNQIRAALWEIQPVSDDDQDLERAALIEQILFKDINWSKFLHEASTAIAHGFSLFEVVHKNKNSKELGDYTGLAQLAYRKQTTITEWNHDPVTGELKSVRQEAFGDIVVNTTIPAEFLLGFFVEQEGDNIGFPLLRALYGPWKRKLLATELQYIGIERFAIPTPILEIPKEIKTSDAEYIEAASVLQGFTSAENSYITYPEGWNLELHNNVFDPSKLSSVIKSEDEAMSGAILAGFLELGIGGNSGAFSLSNDLSDFFLAGIEYYADIIRDTINRCLIPNLMTLNYGENFGAMPKLAYSDISDKAGKELMEIVTGYVDSGVIKADEQLEDHLRKRNNLPPKAEGEQVENQESQGGDSNDEPSGPNDIDADSDDADNDNPDKVQLAETVGHTHKGTGPAIQRGQKHFHEMLDGSGRTKTEKNTAGHVHVIEGNKTTGKPIETKLADEDKENPSSLMLDQEIIIAQIIRDNLKNISNKYINDVLNNYKNLGENDKLKATRGVKIGGVARFRKELKTQFTDAANKSLSQARVEVPTKSNTKLNDDMDAIKLEFKNADNFKFSDFSKLPKRIQILIANQAELISDKEARSIADTVALQFTSSEPSTNDIQVLRDDMIKKADEAIESGTKDNVAANQAAIVVNEARNAFILDEEVQKDIASYTFVNFDPQTDICKTLAGTTYAVSDQDLVRFQPPLHHNCKSYLRANLKANDGKNPDITGLPSISKTAQDSITFGECCK